MSISRSLLAGVAASSVLVLLAPLKASAQDDLTLNSYRLETNDCPGCGQVEIRSPEAFQAYLDGIRAQVGKSANVRGNMVWQTPSSYFNRRGKQVVFIDFDAGGDPVFPVCRVTGFDEFGQPNAWTLFGIFNDHVYTDEERQTITARITEEYKDFYYKFVTERPRKGEYSTLSIGDNDAPLDCSQGSNIQIFPNGGVSILFGRADRIDFLNLDKTDNAFADASLWEFLMQFNPFFFELFSGFDIDADFGGDQVAAVSLAVTNQTSNTGAHEVGHLQGLRHLNSLGPPGQGLPDNGAISPFEFVPPFPGPSNGFETELHTMASGASVGLTLEGSTMTDRFFSERSATRIAIAQTGLVKPESWVRRWGKDWVHLAWLRVPNTIVQGVNADADLTARAVVVEGSIDVLNEVDTYSFKGKKGDLFSAELISVIGRDLTFEEGIIGVLELYKKEKDGTLIPIDFNIQTFESFFDAELLDVELPADGVYQLNVWAPDLIAFDTDGDGLPDTLFRLSDVGGADLLTGMYSVQMYTWNPEAARR